MRLFCFLNPVHFMLRACLSIGGLLLFVLEMSIVASLAQATFVNFPWGEAGPGSQDKVDLKSIRGICLWFQTLRGSLSFSYPQLTLR